MNLKYTIDTQLVNNEKFYIELSSEFNGIRETIMREIIDLKELSIREALIKLGWTPPKGIEE